MKNILLAGAWGNLGFTTFTGRMDRVGIGWG